MRRIEITPITADGRSSRHDHMLRRFSRDPMLILELRTMGVGRAAAEAIVDQVSLRCDAQPPDVTFHRGRGAHTGYCMAPRDVAVSAFGEAAVAGWERHRSRAWPEAGMLRFGDPTTLGTVAHELGHHWVNLLDPARTPPHGKRWVARFDEAATMIASLVRLDR